MLDLVGIPQPEKRADQYTHEFSGGMRQRAMIAMALSLSPGVLIADEPTTALDVTVEAGIVDLVKELGEKYGTSMLFISHNLGLVMDVCNRICVMYSGEAVETGQVVEVFDEMRHPYTQALLSATPLADPAARARRGERIVLSGELPSPLAPPSGCSFRTRCPLADAGCAERRPELLSGELEPAGLTAPGDVDGRLNDLAEAETAEKADDQKQPDGVSRLERQL